MSIFDYITAQDENEAPSLSFENIKHRFNDKLVDELIIEFKSVMEGSSYTSRTLNKTRIPKLIEEYTGIKFDFIVEKDMVNAGVPYVDFSFTANAALSPNSCFSFAQNGAKILRNNNLIDVKVDINTGYIHGIKDISHSIIIGDTFLNGMMDFKASELVAIFMHELGHIWTYYLTLPHIFKSNFLLGEFSERLIGIESREARTVIVEECTKTFGLDFVERETLLTTDSRDELSLIIFTSQVGKMRSMLGSNPYDLRSSEALADQFVVRFGLGKELISGFNRFGVGYNAGVRNDSRASIIGLTLLNLIVAPYIMPVIIILSAFDLVNGEYDNPVKRSEVVVQGMRDRFKECSDPKYKRKLLKDIESLEKEIGAHFEEFGIIHIYFNVVLPWGRSRHRSVNFQKALESLRNNKLATRAEKLKNIT